MTTLIPHPTDPSHDNPVARVLQAVNRHARAKLPEIVGALARAGDVAALRAMLDLAPPERPKNSEAAKKILMPLLQVLKTVEYSAEAIRMAQDWAYALGFTDRVEIDKLLAEQEIEASTTIVATVKGLMALGAHPNALRLRENGKPLTALGHATETAGAQPMSELTVTMLGHTVESANLHRMADVIQDMMENVIARGDVPLHRRNPDGSMETIFDVLLESIPSPTVISAVMGAVGEAAKRGELPITVEEAIGASFLRQRPKDKEPTKSQTEWQRRRLWQLSYARFQNPDDWARALYNPNDETGLACLMAVGAFEEQAVRTIKAMARDGVLLDDIACVIEDNNEKMVPCTLLHRAAFFGKEEVIVALLEGGADVHRKVGEESSDLQIAGLDAEGLWKLGNDDKPSPQLSAWKAKTVIDSVLRKTRAGR